jgi:CRISP-associated protein Cas1
MEKTHSREVVEKMVQGSKVLKVELSNYGSYLGRSKGCFEIRDKTGKIERYPHFQKEIREAVLKSGSYVSVDALVDLALWNIDTYIMTRRNRVVAFLRNVEDDSNVKTRLCQYSSVLDNEKCMEIAKQFVITKIKGQNEVLKKYKLDTSQNIMSLSQIENLEFSNLKLTRQKLMSTESRNAKDYFSQIFKLFPKKIRPETRETYRAYDGLNNVFNFAYYILECRIHKALLKAKLEPYLGFLHSVQHGKPSLVCDFQELYRYLIDDFLIERCQKLHKKDFVLVTDFMMHLKMGKKIHLKEYETNSLAEDLNAFFDRIVDVERIKIGKRQTIDTLISEEALLFAKYLRRERKYWTPRIGGKSQVHG